MLDVAKFADVSQPNPAPYAALDCASRPQLARAILDGFLAFLALIALSPVMALVALAIWMEDGRPVLFRQERHGLGGRVFKIYKFRSMSVTETGCSARQASPGDSRVTRVGRFLRATSLDELPQLFNVVKGDMALVGPRPHAMAQDWEYAPLIPEYMNRYRVKPGMTGLAQVRGLRGPTDVNMMKARLHSDLEYLRRKNIWLDLWIIIQTPRIIWAARNAH